MGRIGPWARENCGNDRRTLFNKIGLWGRIGEWWEMEEGFEKDCGKGAELWVAGKDNRKERRIVGRIERAL